MGPHTKCNMTVIIAGHRNQIKIGLPIVRFPCLICIRLGKHQNASTQGIPLQLDSVGLEKCLLGENCSESGNLIYFDKCWASLYTKTYVSS